MGGSPLRDGAMELLLRKGLPIYRKALFVHAGCGCFLDYLPSGAISTQASHLHCGDHAAFIYNITQSRSPASSYLGWPWETLEIDLPSLDFVCIRIFRDSSLTRKMLRRLLLMVQPDCKLWVFGPNREGIAGAGKYLQEQGCAVQEVACGAGARILQCPAVRPREEFLGEDDACGVFGAEKLDRGTALLLAHLPEFVGKTVLDFGCGAGELARAAIKGGANSVYASDHFYPACAWTAKNMAEKCRVGCHFLHLGITETFDLILSNPPFHGEGGLDTSMGRIWVESCGHMLNGQGKIWLVANSFLDYGKFAKLCGKEARSVFRDRQFAVWEL